MKRYYEKYKHIIPLAIFGVIYVLWFYLLEHRTNVQYMVVHMNIDDYIPFCEYFVVPYLLWFAYVPAVLGYLFFKDRRNYDRCAVFLCTGMLIFLVSQLWQTDTPTNLFPSIHVYNSLGAHFAVMNNETLSGKKWVRRGSLILCVSIILSTMFIKQHSMFDVLMAFIMGAVMYAAVYYYDVVGAYRFQTGKRQRKRARIG